MQKKNRQKKNMQKNYKWIAAGLLAVAVCTAGCAKTKPAKADQEHIETCLSMVTANTRASGTEGETRAAEEIKAQLEQMGYDTVLEPFSQPSLGEGSRGVSGTNVVAVKKPKKNADTADILYITAHHDAKPGIEGAEDDASGVTVLLEAARLVSGLSTDTEVRFVTFSGEEDGRVGSRFHVEGLTEEERARVIGDIQLDDLGYKGGDYLRLETVDGEPVMLGTMLSEQAKATQGLGKAIPCIRGEMSDHNPFHSHGIPAVMLGGDSFAFENHSTQDKTGILDPVKLQQAAQLVADVAAQIMSGKTGSMAGTVAPKAYEIQPETVIQFDMDRNYVENMMGLSGELLKEQINEYQDTVETFRYPIRWFGMEEPLETLFQYRNGFLEMIEIPMQAPMMQSQEEAKALMDAALGEAEVNEMDGGTAYSWSNEVYRKFYSLEPSEDGSYHILVLNYSLGKTIRMVYDLSEGIEAAKSGAAEDTDRKLLELLEQIIYPEDIPLLQFNVYSDGRHASTGYTSALGLDDNTQMEYALDYRDAFDEQGEYREYNETVRTVVHEYGHVLSLNSSQVDISKQDETMPSIMFDKETYAKDAYIRTYYEKFWKDLDVKTGLERYKTSPDEFVSAYAASDLSEDFAESFMLFVLSDRPEDDSIASEKIRFFYDYEEMTARRDYIRTGLGL